MTGTLNATNCYNEGRISGGNNTGGIAGYTNGTINLQNCYNTGEITNSLGQNTGGLIGRDNATSNKIKITSSYNKGKVTGSTYAGGIAGYITGNLHLVNCYNEGDISQENTALPSGYGYSGGLVSQMKRNANLNIINCFNTGIVKSEDWNAGGLMGETAGTRTNVVNCFNSGQIEGKKSAGGVAGMISGGYSNYTPSIKIENFYQMGNLSSTTQISALLRRNTNASIKVYNSYYLDTTAEISIQNTNATEVEDNSLSITDSRLKSIEFLNTLNNYVTNNKTYTIDNLNHSLLSWKSGTNGYPTFDW